MATDTATAPLPSAGHGEARSRLESIADSASPPPDGMGKATVRPPADSPPVRLREVLAVGLSVVAFDLLIYRRLGFTGYAAFFVAVCGLLLVGSPQTPRWKAAAILGGMTLVLAARMVWLGFGFLSVVGIALLVAFAMAAVGRRPYVLDVAVYAFQTILAGFPALVRYGRSVDRLGLVVPRAAWLTFVLPLVAVLAFGTVFVLANPDIAVAVGRSLSRFFEALREGILRFSPRFEEIVLWFVVALVAGGLLRPIVREWVLAPLSRDRHGASDAAEPLFETPLYAAYRNTLVAVIALFAVYLVFEFKTLWFRTFPKGFYYAGYAHEGAAWLTVALALTTFVLSAIFRDSTMRDPRLPQLRKLAWVWSALNLLLALAVYNRLFIYIGFNGMTRMRTIGLFGITAVVVGFLLVVWKIKRDRDFAWLIERQLWTLAVAIFLLAVLPVDPLVHTYNVRRILAGDLAPSVQITEHPVDSGGVLVLPPLAEADDPIIREGIRALLAERALRAEETIRRREEQGWTSFQLADRLLLDRLRRNRTEWEEYTDPEKRAEAWNRFRDYAYQWY